MKKCTVDGCDNTLISRGYCTSHYMKFKRYGDPLKSGTGMPRKPRALGDQAKWLIDAAKYEADDCLIWPFKSKKRRGYGHHQSNYFGEKYANRIICKLAHGEAPSEEHVAAHSCDNPPCCNPRHIRWATQLENMQDALVRDRFAKGEKAGTAKITENDVFAIKELEGIASHRVIAGIFNISKTHVGSILRGEKWKHL